MGVPHARITDRSILISSQRASGAARPARPPWCVLPDGAVAAANGADPADVLVMRPRAPFEDSDASMSVGPAVQNFDRIGKVHAVPPDSPCIVTALAALDDPRFPEELVFAALSDGSVSLLDAREETLSPIRLAGAAQVTESPTIVAEPVIRASPLLGLLPCAPVEVVDLCIAGRSLVGACADGSVFAWDLGADLSSGPPRKLWAPPIGRIVTALVPAPDGSGAFFVADDAGGACVLRVGCGEATEVIPKHEDGFLCCEYGSVLCAAWSTNSKQAPASGETSGIGARASQIRGKCRDDLPELVLGGEDDSVYGVWLGEQRRKALGDTEHASFVTGVAARGPTVASVGMDGRMVLWHRDEGYVALTRDGEAFYAVQWVSDTFLLAAAQVEAGGKCNLYRIELYSSNPGGDDRTASTSTLSAS